MKDRINRFHRLLSVFMAAVLLIAGMGIPGPQTVGAMELGEQKTAPAFEFNWDFGTFTEDKVYKSGTLDPTKVEIKNFYGMSAVKNEGRATGIADFSEGTLLSGTTKGKASITYYNVGSAADASGKTIPIDLKVTLMDWANPAPGDVSDRAYVTFSTCVNKKEQNAHDQKAIGVWPSSNVGWVDLKYEFFEHGTGNLAKISGYFSMVDLDGTQYFAFNDSTGGVDSIYRYENDSIVTNGGGHHITVSKDHRGSTELQGWTTVNASGYDTTPTEESKYNAGYVTFVFDKTNTMNFRFGSRGFESVKRADTLGHYYFGILPHAITPYEPPTPKKYVSDDSAAVPDLLTGIRDGRGKTTVTLNDGSKTVYYVCDVSVPRSLTHNYSSFQFNDTVNAGLKVKSVSVYQDYQKDVSSYFEISAAQTVTARATQNAMNEKNHQEFFGHSYQMVIKAEVSAQDTTLTNIPNRVSCVTGVYNYGNSSYTPKTTTSNYVYVNYYKPVLSITKKADRSTCEVGDTVTYTITVKQTTSGATARNAYIQDNSLPTELFTVTSASATKNGSSLSVTRNGNHVRTSAASIGSSDTLVLTVRATVKKAFASFINTAYAYADNCGSVSAKATVEALEPTLNVKKYVSSPEDGTSFQIGETAHYQIQVTNPESGTTLDNLVVEDKWDSGLSLDTGSIRVYYRQNVTSFDSPTSAYALSSSSYSVTQLSGGFRVTLLGSMKNMSVGTLTIEYDAAVTSKPSGNRITNRVTATTSNAGTDYASRTINVGLCANAELTKEVDKYDTWYDDDIVYTVLLENTGNYSIFDFELSDDTLPSGFELESLRVEHGEKNGMHMMWNQIQSGDEDIYYSRGSKDWRVYSRDAFGSIPPGDAIRVTAMYYVSDRRISRDRDITNTASFTGVAKSDGVSVGSISKNASAKVRVRSPELEITKISDKEIYDVGETATYTLDIHHKEGSEVQETAYQVFINDTGSSYMQMQDIVAVEYYSHMNGYTRKLNPSEYSVGQIASANSGSTALTSSAVSVSGSMSDVRFGIKTNLNLNPGDRIIVTYREKVTAAVNNSLVNTATVQALNTAAASTTHTVGVTQPKLQITKTADKSVCGVLHDVHYTVTVTQTEQSQARNILLTDNLGMGSIWKSNLDRSTLKVYGTDGSQLSGVTFSSNSADNGFQLSFGSLVLGAGESVTITYDVWMSEETEYTAHGGAITNTASASATAVSPVSASWNVEVYRPQITIDKQVSQYEWRLKDRVQYTVDVKNTGYVDAENVTLSDSGLPSFIDIDGESITVSVVNSEGTESEAGGATLQDLGQSFRVTKDVLASGETLRVRYEAEVKKGVRYNREYTNTALANADNASGVRDTAAIIVRGVAKVTVYLTKRIRASDINFGNGGPSFMMNLKGTDTDGVEHSLNQNVYFTEDYVKAHTGTDGYAEITAVFDRVPAGIYTASEEQASRYRFAEIRDVKGGMAKGETIAFDFSDAVDEDAFYGTFVNELFESQYFTDTQVVVNHFSVDEESRED